MKKCITCIILCAMLLAMAAVSAESTHVVVYADPAPPTAITVDGEITTAEWGEPAAVYTYSDLKNQYKGWTVWRYFGNSDDFKDQALELYARRDAENLYFGFRFVNIHHIDYAYTGKNPQHHPCMKMAIGAFSPDTNIETEECNGETIEKWLSYTVRPRYDEDADVFFTEIEADGSIGFDSYTIPNGAVYVNEDDNSYHYEIVLPYKDMYGVIAADTEDVVLSFQMNDAHVAGSDGGNRWFVSEAVRLATKEKDPQAFLDSNPIRLIYDEEPTAVTPDPSGEPAAKSFSIPWYLPVIAAVVIGAAVVIVIIKIKKEKQR